MVAMQFFYKAFGFGIVSEIELPELPRLYDETFQIDIGINFGYIPDSLELEMQPYYHFVKDDKVLFNIPGIANFLVQDGKNITVSLINETDEDVLRLYLLGTCMGIILMQRKVIPLHGSAVKINGKAYAIIGESGAGKSTLASAFIKRGYKLISDDIIPVVFSESDIPAIVPSYPQQKLWEKSLNEFGIETRNYRPIYDRESKYAVPIPNDFTKEVTPLAGIFELDIEGDKNIKLTKAEGLHQLNILLQHTYRNFIIPRLGLTEWHFKTSAKIASQVDTFTLTRPTEGFTAENLISTILKTIDKEEIKC